MEKLKDWDPILNRIIGACKDIKVLPVVKVPWLKELVAHERILFTGDSAHATSGIFSAGTSFAFEDAKALELTLKHVYAANSNQWTTDSVKQILTLYNTVRAPHYKMIFPQWEAYLEFFENHQDEVAVNYSTRNIDHIVKHDVTAAFNAAVAGSE
ncbi:unnamed protein product [Clonostachys rosea]|uniref:FAD-binding domain-containing protein n=1 Tax=Bionectria ochroleuca TaxID=29856 RepID=A0ABY6U9N7_BIOOC|nr:unnamed protein product [Clonostachys rosea]